MIHDIQVVAEAISGYLAQLGINPDERSEHDGKTTAEFIAMLAVVALERDTALRYGPP